jgi:hypothetical protein
MKKIIAFIIPALNIGGAEKVTLSIIKNIDKKKIYSCTYNNELSGSS